MINFDNYEKAYKDKETSILSFHDTVANHFRDKDFLNMRHKLLESLGPDIYTDTGNDNEDFRALAFSIGSNNKSIAREKYEFYKRRDAKTN